MSIKYRPDIDGLRTIAVLSVIFYHAQFNYNGTTFFQGGFIGVDIFFVISGYLIGAILLKEITRGSFSYLDFYERRARRILPALFTVMGVTLPLAWFLMLPTTFMEYAGSGIASLGFSSNIWFWLEDSYTADASTLKPFLHTWSLSVEEQFYLFFPPLVWLCLKQKRIKFGTVLIMSMIASLISAQIYSAAYPNAAFFLLPFRIWELLAGVWLAYITSTEKQSNYLFVNGNLSWVGLLILLVSIIFFNDTMQHPSVITLLPVIGTCLIIGRKYHESFTGRFLSSRPMVFIGLLSYSFYLWHVPVFVFSKLAEWPQSNIAKICYIILAAFLALISWHFIEKPYRNRTAFSLRAVIILLGASLIGLIAAFTYIYVSNGVPKRIGLSEDIVKTFKAPTKSEYCKGLTVSQGVKLCEFGTPNKAPNFMVIGDSHSTITLGVFDKLAKENSMSGILASEAGCLPFLGVYTRDNEPERSQCSKLISATYQYLLESKIKRVFMVARWSYYTSQWRDEYQFVSVSYDHLVKSQKESRANFETALTRSISTLLNAGIEVIILSQPPQQYFTAERAYTIAGNSFNENNRAIDKIDEAILSDNSVRYEDHKKLQSFANNAFSSYANTVGVTLLNFDATFCEDRCKIGTSKVSYYRDDDHLSSFGVGLIEPQITEIFNK